MARFIEIVALLTLALATEARLFLEGEEKPSPFVRGVPGDSNISAVIFNMKSPTENNAGDKGEFLSAVSKSNMPVLSDVQAPPDVPEIPVEPEVPNVPAVADVPKFGSLASQPVFGSLFKKARDMRDKMCMPFRFPLVCELKNKTSQEITFSKDCNNDGSSPFSECVEFDKDKFPPSKSDKKCPFLEDMDMKVCKPRTCTEDSECGAGSVCAGHPHKKPKPGAAETGEETEEVTKHCRVSCPWRLLHMACKVVNGSSTETYPCMKPSMSCNEDISEPVTIDGHELSLSFCKSEKNEKKFFGSKDTMLDLCQSCQPGEGRRKKTPRKRNQSPGGAKRKLDDLLTVFCGKKNLTTEEECENPCNSKLFPYLGVCASHADSDGALKSCPVGELSCQRHEDCGDMKCMAGKCVPSCEAILFHRACFIYNETSGNPIPVTSCMTDEQCNYEKTETIPISGHNYQMSFADDPWKKKISESKAFWMSALKSKLLDASELDKCTFIQRMMMKFVRHENGGTTRGNNGGSHGGSHGGRRPKSQGGQHGSGGHGQGGDSQMNDQQQNGGRPPKRGHGSSHASQGNTQQGSPQWGNSQGRKPQGGNSQGGNSQRRNPRQNNPNSGSPSSSQP